ncbi:MAG TPA: hypothetical protein PK597_02990 [Oscillospiraceae bacterium]|nr:hypothetical protein [Oscillospiraceae bacterium]
MRRRAVETAKSALIVLLMISAAYLAVQVSLYSGSASDLPRAFLTYVSSLLGHTENATEETPAAEASRPVRIAVTNDTGRRGVQYSASETDGIFAATGTLLTEALSDLGTPVQTDEGAWRAALTRHGVYFDFLGKVPLTALSAWLSGTSETAVDAPVRRVLLAREEDGGVSLYFKNEDDGRYYVCRTSDALADRLESAIAGYLSNGATFAFEQGERYAQLEPDTLLLGRAVDLPVLSASNPVAGDEQKETLLRLLDFNPHTATGYPVEGGYFVRDGNGTLRVSEDGTVRYAATGEEDRYTAASAGEEPTQTELIEAARALAARTVGALCGSSVRLYLVDADEQADGTSRVRFGYCTEGAQIAVPNDGCAAEIVFTGARVTSMTLYFRAYETTETTVTLLPERQAAAALAVLREGGELIAGYVDGGTDTLSPKWLGL